MLLVGHGTISKPAFEANYVPREVATALQRVKLPKGLRAKFVARNVG